MRAASVVTPSSTKVVETEFDRQCAAALAAGLPALLALDEPAFVDALAPLRAALAAVPAPAEGNLPFVLVAGPAAPADQLIARVPGTRSKPAFTSMTADDLAGFTPTAHAPVPAGPYLLVDLDTGGRDTLNVPPQEVLPRVLDSGRSPLTVAEGLALLLADPKVLRTRNCFSLLGSRCGDRRVPALWVSGGVPRLGWCWDGAPHTWLGSASCGGRISAT